MTILVYEKIRKLRKARGLSQAKFANLLNINYTQYNKYETGKVKIPADVLISIAMELGVSIDYLLTGKEIEHHPAGMLKDDVFAHLVATLQGAEINNYSEEELDALRGSAKLITGFLKQRRRSPKTRKK